MLTIHEHQTFANERFQQLRQEAQESRAIQAAITNQLGQTLNRLGSQLTRWGQQLQESQDHAQLLGNLQ